MIVVVGVPGVPKVFGVVIPVLKTTIESALRRHQACPRPGS